MEEIWKVYPHVSNKCKLLEVSNFGNVKVNGKLVDFSVRNRIYHKVCHHNVHRMVAELFVPNPDDKPFVDHIDTNRHNNRADNLRWVTPSENNKNPITLVHFKEGAQRHFSNTILNK